MRVFRELKLCGSRNQLEYALIKIENSLVDGWTRNRELEDTIASVISDRMYCFSCIATESREAANLWLTYLDDNTLYVSNIIPSDIRWFRVEQYNKIIYEFYVKFVKPTAKLLDLEHILTSDTKELQEWVSTEAASKLQKFARVANKNTGSAHPMDQARWFDFVVATHAESTNLDSDILARWLEEVEGWPEDTAYNLSQEYEYSRSLLKAYDAMQA